MFLSQRSLYKAIICLIKYHTHCMDYFNGSFMIPLCLFVFALKQVCYLLYAKQNSYFCVPRKKESHTGK